MSNTQSIREGANESNILRNALRANASFSFFSGLILLLGAQPAAQFMGIQEPLVLRFMGIVLVLFAVDLIWIASKDPIDRRLAWAVTLLDVAWVLGSVVILITDLVPLTVAGRWAVALVAEVVAVFAVLEFIGLRRLR